MRNVIYTGFLSSFTISSSNFPIFTIEDKLNSKIKKSIFEFHKSLKTSIPITLLKTKSLGGNLAISLRDKKKASVIYNTFKNNFWRENQ